MDSQQLPYLAMGPTSQPDRLSQNLMSPFMPQPYMTTDSDNIYAQPPSAPVQLILSPTVTPTTGFYGVPLPSTPTPPIMPGQSYIPSPVSMMNCSVSASLYDQLKFGGASGLMRYPSPLTIFTPPPQGPFYPAIDGMAQAGTASPHDLLPAIRALDISGFMDPYGQANPNATFNANLGSVATVPNSMRSPIVYYQSSNNETTAATGPPPSYFPYPQQQQHSPHPQPLQQAQSYGRRQSLEYPPGYYNHPSYLPTLTNQRLMATDNEKQYTPHGYERQHRLDNFNLGNRVNDWIPPGEEVQILIVERVEVMFSDEYLFKDTFMLKHILRNKDGYVNLKLISALRKIKRLTQDWKDVQYSIQKRSRLLTLNKEGTKVKRSSMPNLWNLSVFNNSTLMLAYDVPSANDPDVLNALKTNISRISRSVSDNSGKQCPDFIEVVWYKVFPAGCNVPNDTFNLLNQFHCGSGMCTFIVAEYASVSDANFATQYLNEMYHNKCSSVDNFAANLSAPRVGPWFKLIPQVLVVNLKLDTPVTQRTTSGGDERPMVLPNRICNASTDLVLKQMVSQTQGIIPQTMCHISMNHSNKPTDSGYVNVNSDRSSFQTDSFGESTDSSSVFASSTSILNQAAQGGTGTMGGITLSPADIYDNACQTNELIESEFRDRSKSLNVGVRLKPVVGKARPITGMNSVSNKYPFGALKEDTHTPLPSTSFNQPLENLRGGSELAINQLMRTREYTNFVKKYMEMIHINQSSNQAPLQTPLAHSPQYGYYGPMHPHKTNPHATLKDAGMSGSQARTAHSLDHLLSSRSLETLSKCLSLAACDRTEYPDIKSACDNINTFPKKIDGSYKLTFDPMTRLRPVPIYTGLNSCEDSFFRSRAATYTPDQPLNPRDLLQMLKLNSSLGPQQGAFSSHDQSLWRPNNQLLQPNNPITTKVSMPKCPVSNSTQRRSKDVASQTSLLGTLQIPKAQGVNLAPKSAPFNASDPSMLLQYASQDNDLGNAGSIRRLSYNPPQDSPYPLRPLTRFDFVPRHSSKDESTSGSSCGLIQHSPFSPFSPTCPTISWLSNVKRQPIVPEEGAKGFYNLENIKRA